MEEKYEGLFKGLGEHNYFKSIPETEDKVGKGRLVANDDSRSAKPKVLKDYKVVTHWDIEEFSKLVLELLKQGYVKNEKGLIIHTHTPPASPYSTICYTSTAFYMEFELYE